MRVLRRGRRVARRTFEVEDGAVVLRVRRALQGGPYADPARARRRGGQPHDALADRAREVVAPRAPASIRVRDRSRSSSSSSSWPPSRRAGSRAGASDDEEGDAAAGAARRAGAGHAPLRRRRARAERGRPGRRPPRPVADAARALAFASGGVREGGRPLARRARRRSRPPGAPRSASSSGRCSGSTTPPRGSTRSTSRTRDAAARRARGAAGGRAPARRVPPGPRARRGDQPRARPRRGRGGAGARRIRSPRPPRLRAVAQQLWFLRHGEAEPHGEREPDDDRALTERGREQSLAGRVARSRRSTSSSSSRSRARRSRALETAELACDHLGVEPIVHEPLRQGFDADEALTLLHAAGDDQRILAHRPRARLLARSSTTSRARGST